MYLTVVPISREIFDAKMSKPFKYPLRNQAWRLLFYSVESSNRYVEIISGPKDTPQKYIVRYLVQPTPIILVKLPDGLTINGYIGADNTGKAVKDDTASQGLGCILDDELHPEIL